jgi:D-arabinose 5-phosphate isomerase GutQ
MELPSTPPDPEPTDHGAHISARLRAEFPSLFGGLDAPPRVAAPRRAARLTVSDAIAQRTAAIQAQLKATLETYADEVEQAAELLLEWMVQGKIVRVLGAGRARLAATIPAHRLAHGGARVHIQDDIVPMPHIISGGGIIAASASGETKSVLDVMHQAWDETRDITILGIAKSDAARFATRCHIFIGIEPEPTPTSNPLRALADSEEYVLSELLDGLVVAAGQLGGFDDAFWRIGHENMGPTGPYGFGQGLR